MSSDEFLAFFASFILGLWAWIVYLKPLFTVSRSGVSGGTRGASLLAVVGCILTLNVVLQVWSADDVRTSTVYMWFYMIMGAAWLGIFTHVLGFFGLSVRDDAVERGNPGAVSAIAGGQLGITLAFAGGNIGNGPGWWVVVFCGALSTGGLFLMWWLLDRISGTADVITIERDPAAGLRAGGFFVACGLVLGRAVAGDWISSEATLADFGRVGGPVLVLLPLAAAIERLARPEPHQVNAPMISLGIMPACLYVGLALFYVAGIGPW